MGDPQVTINYTRALSDFITNFCFSRGVEFTTPKATQHIIPALLKRVWEQDNNKPGLLWTLGNYGSVSGDVFVKVAYDPPYQNGVGEWQAGRIKILPLNPSHCFPEFHPHDADRMVRFKLKYRFWDTTPEGTRQVFTYTEILTDDTIEEYLNDELIDRRPNPLGVIPVVHAPNIHVAGSPWGVADIADIIAPNRLYNELMTDITEIINYHAAPVTIIKGAKASNLEKGSRKVWGGLPKDADVFNLENGVNLDGPLKMAAMLKTSMHELTGVPESALGQVQPISNTSGVALAIMYQPMMQRLNQKKITYGKLFHQINVLALKTLFEFEPQTLEYDPNTEGIFQPQDGQQEVLDPMNPITYEHVVEWVPPLPVDALIKLQEVQQKMALGLESKRGALRDMGEAFPDEKMQEIFEELVQDAKDQASLDLLQAHTSAVIAQMTGMVPETGAQPVPPAKPGPAGPDGQPAPEPTPPPAIAGLDLQAITGQGDQEIMNEIVTKAYGTKLGTSRLPSVN
jgi:hypothetical protein